MNKSLSLLAIIVVVAGLLALPIAAQALTVTTNKSIYHPGDAVRINGTASPNTVVTFVMTNPDGQLVAVDQVKTDANGKFDRILYVFPEEPTGLIKYGTYTITVYDSTTDEKVTLTIDFAPVLAVLKGKVVDGSGNPVEGATVAILLNGATVASTTTAADGTYSLEVNPGVYVLKVTKEGYTPYEEAIDLSTPGVYTKDIVLQFKALNIEIISITHFKPGSSEAPFLGIVREGEIIKVEARVTYGDQEVTDAIVKVCIVPPTEELEKTSFDLSYDTESGYYVGNGSVPVLGLDRQSTLVIKATWQNMTATVSKEMYILVDYGSRISDLEQTVSDIKKTVDDLKDTVMNLQLALGEVSIRLSTLENTVKTLEDSVKELRTTVDDLKFTTDRLSIEVSALNASITVINGRLDSLTKSINELSSALSNLADQVNTRLGDMAKEVATLKANVSSLSATLDANIKALQAGLNTLSTDLGNLRSDVAKLTENMNNNINVLKQSIDALTSTLYATLAVAIIALLIAIVVLILVFKKISG